MKTTLPIGLRREIAEACNREFNKLCDIRETVAFAAERFGVSPDDVRAAWDNDVVICDCDDEMEFANEQGAVLYARVNGGWHMVCNPEGYGVPPFFPIGGEEYVRTIMEEELNQ